MRKRILLFFPNTSNRGRITTAIPILGGIARDRGWEVTYIDTSFYEKDTDSVIEREKTGGFRPGPKETMPDMIPQERLVPDLQAQIDKLKPDILAITAMTCDYQYMMTFLPQLKISKETLVVIGGLHASFKEDEVLDTGLFDLVCFGQGEMTFTEILSRVEEGKQVDNIVGTCFKDKKRGKFVRNPKRPLLPPEKLWETEEEYSYFDERYFRYPFDGKAIKMFWVDLGRGCPYACSYCGNTALKSSYKGLGQYIVSRSLDSTFGLLRNMLREYKVGVFNITHECFLAQPLAWLKEFSERWSKEIRKPFLIVTRAETVTEEKLNILKKSEAPIIQVGLGVESGSERILRDICNRRIKIETIIHAYDLLHQHGFRSNAYYMLGFPTETRGEIFETIEVCRRLNAHIDSVSIFQPYPGQPLTDFCIQRGYITGKERIPSFTEGSILKMTQISTEEIGNLRRTFLLYAKLPKKYWPEIEKCEKDYEAHRDLYDELVKLRWELADGKTKEKVNIGSKN